MVAKAFRAYKEYRASKVDLVILDLQEAVDRKVFQDLKDFQVKQPRSVTLVAKVTKDLRDQRAILEVTLVAKVIKDLPVAEASKVIKV